MSGAPGSQLLLDLQWDDTPRLDGFEPGANGIALQALQQLLAEGGALYLWGPPGSGRSHLLRAACAALQQRGAGALYLRPDAPPSHWPALDAPGLTLLAIDDVQDCAPWQQELLFGLFNVLRQRGAGFLAAGDRAPAQLALRDDLRTRLAWGLALALQPLDDAAKARVLQRIGAGRGLELRDELSRYILTHHARDMRSLVELVDQLDAYALRHSRAASIPLLKEMLAGADRPPPAR